MKEALKQLLDDLDQVAAVHDEIGDTDVREQMYEVVHKAFIAPQSGYKLPDSFGMFTDEGDAKVKWSLARFLAHPDLTAATQSLKTPHSRLDAFQDSVESSKGTSRDEYFGWADAP